METTTPELTLAQRFAADTPTLFKKIGIFGLGLVAVGTGLTQTAEIPIWISATLIAVGTTMNLLSNFVVKDTSVLSNPNATIQDYSAVLADLPKQFEQLHAGIANTVAAIKTGQVTPEVPVVETPIVKDPVPNLTIPTDAQTALQQIANQQASLNPVGYTPLVSQGLAIPPNLNPNVSPQN